MRRGCATLAAESERLLVEMGKLTTGDSAAFPDAPRDDLDDVRGDEVGQAQPLSDSERNQEIYDVLVAELARVTPLFGD